MHNDPGSTKSAKNAAVTPAIAPSRSRSPYDCSVHRVPMVKEVILLSPEGRGFTGLQQVSFFRCPMTNPQTKPHQKGYDPQGRCLQMKPNKWENRKMYDRTMEKTSSE